MAKFSLVLPALAVGVVDANADMDFEGISFGAQALEARVPMHLHLFNDTDKTGAVCIDGTPAGFYFAEATGTSNSNDWQLYFEGGGWCYDELDCWGRSNSNLGSSSKWPSTASAGGIMSDDCSSNPDFCNFNRVYMKYCDGNSFSGNRDEPITVVGTDGKAKKLYFRGRRILDEILNTLASNHGLTKASNVLLTGCSAGGLATYLHTDYVHDRLKQMAPGLQKYGASSISGFFLQHKNIAGDEVYPTQMKYIFNLANSTHGVNDKCIASLPLEDQWQCNFAQHAYAHTESRTFPLNSALDSWQTGCIFTSALPSGFPNQTDTSNGQCNAFPDYSQCSGDPEKCNTTQTKAINQYITDFNGDISDTSAPTYNKPGNGAFIHSCHTHCEAQGSAWNKFAVDGVTMQQAVSKWWNSDGTEPSSAHTYTPCLYKEDSTPRKCNPTC